MNFKLASMVAQFQKELDPQVRLVVESLDTYSAENSIPGVWVTEVVRTPQEQEAIYLGYADRILYRVKAGHHLTDSDRHLALELHRLPREKLRDWARQKFSWHMVGQAVDLRSRHYTEKQMQHVMDFLTKRCPKPAWELLAHDVTAEHVHIAFKSPEKRKAIQ